MNFEGSKSVGRENSASRRSPSEARGPERDPNTRVPKPGGSEVRQVH